MLLIVLAVNQSFRTCVNPQNSTQFSKLRNFVELSLTIDFKKNIVYLLTQAQYPVCLETLFNLHF